MQRANGWAVGSSGAIIHWNGAEWVSEFSSFLVLPLLMIVTASAIIDRSRKLKNEAVPKSALRIEPIYNDCGQLGEWFCCQIRMKRNGEKTHYH